MNKLLYRFREFKEKCRRDLIHKLGGFSIMPPSKDLWLTLLKMKQSNLGLLTLQ